MRSDKLLVLAGLASYALALPTKDLDPRTFGLVAEIITDLGEDLTGFIEALLGGGVKSSASLLTGISAQAAAVLEGGALGCTAGKIDASARAELAAWIRAHASFDASLKSSLLAWCEGEDSATLSVDVRAGLALFIPTCAEVAAKGDIYVTVDGIFSVSDLEAAVVLSSSFQSTLSTFISGSVGAELDVDIKAGLSLCAGGGVVADLASDIEAALKVWLNGSECSLSASLKAAVLAWLEGKASVSGVVTIGTVPTAGLTTVSVGAAINALVETSGALTASAQAYLSAFLKSSLATDIEADVKVVLEACISGKLATSVSADARAALAVWLSGDSCQLGVELKAVLYFWLSFALSGDVTVDLSTDIITELETFITGTIDTLIGVNISGVLSLLLSGESLASLSLESRAELSAVIGGCAGVDISSSIEIIVIEWLTGCSIPGGPSIGSGSGSGSGSS
ncbi:putative cell wall protein, partial [Aspergillus vadensis CBS 113365]